VCIDRDGAYNVQLSSVFVYLIHVEHRRPTALSPLSSLPSPLSSLLSLLHYIAFRFGVVNYHHPRSIIAMDRDAD
jgi:hypothetical protein